MDDDEVGEEDEDDDEEEEELDGADDAAGSDDASSDASSDAAGERVLSAWGSKKSTFYNADEEAEADDDAAAAEEVEARRLQRKRAKALDEEDLAFGALPAGPASAGGAAVERVSRDASGLSRSAKLDIVMGDTPELVALLDGAQAALREVRASVAPLLSAAREGRVALSGESVCPARPGGVQRAA